MQTGILAALSVGALLAGCASPETVATRRCSATGLMPGDPEYAMCFEHEMDRIQAGYAAMAGIGVGMMQASRPVYPTTIVVQP